MEGMDKRVRTCFGCRFFEARSAEPGCSEYTPGSDFGMECYKGHWRFDPYMAGPLDMYRNLSMADTCPDYTFSQERAQ